MSGRGDRWPLAEFGDSSTRAARVASWRSTSHRARAFPFATVIATSGDDGAKRGPEHASIVDERIAVVPFAEADLRKEHS